MIICLQVNIFYLELSNHMYVTLKGPLYDLLQRFDNHLIKDLYSTEPKRGSVFIGLMTPDGAIWSRYQRTVLMRRSQYLCRRS